MFGDKEFNQVGYPTPTSLPDTTVCRTLQIPASGEWEALIMGALMQLSDETQWQQLEGGITRADAAARAQAMIDDAYDNLQCAGVDIAPYWDDPEGDDAEGNPSEGEGFPWYENLADFVITAFLAVSFTPAAAIEFVSTARQVRLLFRQRDYGAILKIFIDGVLYQNADTYSPTPGLLAVDLPLGSTHTIRIEHSGTHNIAATPTALGYGMEVIRKRLWSEEVDAITDIRQQAGSGQLQIQRGSLPAWSDVPTADNVRRDGTTIMTGLLQVQAGADATKLGTFGWNGANVEVGAATNHPVYIIANGLRHLRVNADKRVQIGDTATLMSAFLAIRSATASKVLLALRNISAQTANQAEGYDSADVLLWSIDATGKATWRGSSVLQAVTSVQPRDVADRTGSWPTPTDASRKGRYVDSVRDATALREVMRGESDGSNPMVGFLGHAAALRQTVTGSRNQNVALASALAALVNFGLITDSSTLGVAPIVGVTIIDGVPSGITDGGTIVPPSTGGTGAIPTQPAPAARGGTANAARCLAAANAANGMRHIHDDFRAEVAAHGLDPLGVAVALLVILAALLIFPPIAGAILGFIGVIFALGIDIEAAEISDADFIDLVGLFYCNSQSTGGVVTFSYGALQGDLLADSRDAFKLMSYELAFIGGSGINALGGLTAITSYDCSTYACAPQVCMESEDFSTGDFHWTTSDIGAGAGQGTYVAATGWRSVVASGQTALVISKICDDLDVRVLDYVLSASQAAGVTLQFFSLTGTLLSAFYANGGVCIGGCSHSAQHYDHVSRYTPGTPVIARFTMGIPVTTGGHVFTLESLQLT